MTVSGNHYFDAATLQDLLSVHEANTLDRHGLYSQALLAADASAIQTVYQNNGFSQVKVSTQTNLVAAVSPSKVSPTEALGKPEGLTVEYQIDEGPQQRVGTLTLQGNTHVETTAASAVAQYRERPVVFSAKPCRRSQHSTHQLPGKRI